MTLQDILSADSGRQRRKRVGRGIGSGRGKTCGRGHKGAYARTGGGGVGVLYEGGQFPLWQRLPRRGFSNFAHTTRYQAVRLGWAVERIEGDITLDALVAAGLARQGALVKLVAGGEVSVPKGLKIAVHAITGSVKAAVEAAGGSVECLHA